MLSAVVSKSFGVLSWAIGDGAVAKFPYVWVISRSTVYGCRTGDFAMQTDNDIPDWRITGDWWDLCNCAIGCPCNFGSDPTYGFCGGGLTWVIRDGNYGDFKFTKDLAVVLISHWEGNVMEKNREFGFLIDDRANSAERAALEKIFTGYAGGAFTAWRDLTI